MSVAIRRGGAGADEIVRIDLGRRCAGEQGQLVAVERRELLAAVEADDLEVPPRAVGRGGVLPGEGEVGDGHGRLLVTRGGVAGG